MESGDPVLVKFGTDCQAILLQSLANGEKMLSDRIVESLDKLVRKVPYPVTFRVGFSTCLVLCDR